MTECARRLGVGRRIAAAATAVVAAAAVSLGPVAAPQVSAQSPGLEVLGDLDPGCSDLELEPGDLQIDPLGIDSDRRRLYARMNCGGNRLLVYDLKTEIPTLVQESAPNVVAKQWWPSNDAVVAPEAGRIYLLTRSGGGGTVRTIEVLDLESLEHLDTWILAEQVPGFQAVALTHDPDRGRLYLAGGFEGQVHVHEIKEHAAGLGGVPPQAAMVAVDDTSGERIWINPLRQCDAVLFSPKQGAFIGMSARGMLYAFCRPTSVASTTAGQSGLVRLNVSGQGDDTGLVDFPMEFFPVSGTYSDGGSDGGGVAAMDVQRERFFVHSLSNQTHGAWVFDGLRSSWIGFVPAPNKGNKYVGVDPATGKHYMGGNFSLGGGTSVGYINVTDGGATPVPQGRRFTDFPSPTRWGLDAGVMRPVSGDILVDPLSRRLFFNTSGSGGEGALVLRDTTPPITPLPPIDLDSRTQDLPDNEAHLEFSANTSGFGAKYVQVGGWENVYSRPTVPLLFFTLAGIEPNPAEIRYGNRGATTSLVEGIGISESGSSATAISTQPDDNTPADVETKSRPVTDEVENLEDDEDDEETQDGREEDATPQDALEEAQRFEHATCLDGIGERVENERGTEGEPAYAAVTCDKEKLETTGLARFSGGTGAGGVMVGASSFDGRTYREPGEGVVAESVATAEGIAIGDSDLGGVTIDRVTTTSTIVANGRPGSTLVRWERVVEGARRVDADGNVSPAQSCTTTVESGKDEVEEDDCSDLVADLNEAMQNRFEIKFPLPEVVATPKGAFASVQENETDFLSGQATNNDERRMVPGMEVTVFADGAQRGRLWVQMAAVRSDATFIRSPQFTFDGGGGTSPAGGTSTPRTENTDAPVSTQGSAQGSTGGPSSSTGSLGEWLSPGPEPTAAAPTVAVGEPPDAPNGQPLAAGTGWFPTVRSLGEGLLTGVLYLLFLFPIAEVIRRRRLLRVLTASDPAPA